MDEHSMGFNAKVLSKKERDAMDIFADLQPQDLIKYGLIPEFVGRLPLTVSLQGLDEDALVRILTEPKNALTRQYQKLFAMDGVKLEFEHEALVEVAKRTMERKTGARGLRAILEKAMLDVMYTLPSENNVKRCIITPETIDTGKAKLEHKTKKSA